MRRMSFIVVCGLLSLSVSALEVEHSSLYRRDAVTILNNLKDEDTALKVLTTDLNAWTGTAGGWLKINSDVNAFTKSLRTTYANCTATTSITTTQANQIVSYLQNPLEPDYKADANAFISKIQTVKSAGLYNIFKQYIATIKTNTTSVGNCLYSKIPATPTAIKTSASAVIARINADVQSIANAYP